MCLRKALDNFVAAPLEDIAKKLGASSVVSKVGFGLRFIFCKSVSFFLDLSFVKEFLLQIYLL